MIPLFKVSMPPSVIEPLKETLLSGYIGQGPKVEEFEAQLAHWFGRKNVVTVNSGTSALHLAMRLADVGPGDEVISTPMTCTATNMPILERGAKIVWADINPLTGNIDPEDVRKKITTKTAAIVVVHWGGYPCDLDELHNISRDYGIPVIEDAAHAFGAQYKGKPIGSHSQFVCFSFQAIKHLTTVDGGALVCRDDKDYERAKLLRWYGIDRTGKRKDLRCEEDILEYGYKFHMNDVAATIGLEQLKHVDHILHAHRFNAMGYEKALELMKPARVRLPDYKKDRFSAYWLFTILVSDRDEFRAEMEQREIMASQVHVRNDQHTAFKSFVAPLPGVDEFSKRQISVPVGWWLTHEEKSKIIDAMLAW